jgi:ABC-2 type transport system ATP-binding protein
VAAHFSSPWAADDLLERIGLVDTASSQVGTLSGGQRRRLDVALGLVGRPELLFLDEPTTGFDPEARLAVWELLDGVRDAGTTILLTTHDLFEAKRLADRIAILAHGRVRATGTAEELASAAPAGGRGRSPLEDAYLHLVAEGSE